MPFSAVAASWNEPVAFFQVRDVIVNTDTLFFLCTYMYRYVHIPDLAPDKTNLNKKNLKTTKTSTFLFIGEIWKWHFYHLKVKAISFVCHWNKRLLSWEKCVHSLGIIFFKICVLFIICMSCSPKTGFVSWHPKLLFHWNCREKKKHISQKCLRSTLRTVQLPKSNLKWRTTFSNILFRTAHGH